MNLEMEDVSYLLGQLYNHFHVKEKLIFPVLERNGHILLTRDVWREDDRILGLYQGAKTMIERVDERKVTDVQLMFYTFASAFRSMIFQEEKFLFPIVLELFNQAEWNQIAEEISAYGYNSYKQQMENIPRR